MIVKIKNKFNKRVGKWSLENLEVRIKRRDGKYKKNSKKNKDFI